MIKWDVLYNHLIQSKRSEIGELHHITPKHMNGSDDVTNLVRLTHRYHILAHYILYRWKRQLGDKIAYSMMSGRISNPMHDDEIRKYHKQIMNTINVKTKISVSQKKRFSDISERKKVSEHRKKYINSLPDKNILTLHMQTPECRKKSHETNLRIRKENPEYFSEIGKRASAATKETNKHRSKSELQKI